MCFLLNNLKQITTVAYGKSTLPGNLVFYQGDSSIEYPIDFFVFLLRKGEKTILIDAGCETMPGFIMKDFKGSVRALAEIGVAPDDITDLIITHAHHDHIECAKYFRNSVVHIQKDEYEKAGKYLADNTNLNVFENEFTVCDGVKIIKIGGHTKGSCIVEIDNNIIAVGDECYMKECIDKQVATGVSFCLEKSKEFIKKYSNSSYTLLFSHSANS